MTTPDRPHVSNDTTHEPQATVAEPAASKTDVETRDRAPTHASQPTRRERLRKLARPGAIAAAIALAFFVGLSIRSPQTDEEPPTSDEATEHAAHEDMDQVLWTCSMHPQIRMSEPGKCPICGMDLVPMKPEPKQEGQVDDDRRVTLSPRARELAEVRTSAVIRTDPRAEVRLLGRVDYDETRLHMVTPWTSGRIDKLHVRVTGTKVRKGQVVATLYSPEVYAAMRDLIVASKQAKKLAKGLHGSANLASAALESARERLRLLGVSRGQIKNIESSSSAPTHIRVTSPFSGTVLERKVEEGDYVSTGTALYHIADLSRVWVQIDAYESDLPHLAVGQPVIVELESLPDERFEGKVAFIDPVVDKKTRTARVRVEVPNKDGNLRPGMFAEAVIESEPGRKQSHLVIPTSAVLFTGRRSVVYVAVADQPGTYELREVRLGPKAGPVYPVLAGLSEGERVVSQGAFVIDADLQLGGGRSMMTLSGDERDLEEAVPVTPETLAMLEPVMEAYLHAQASLAADDFAQARTHLEALAEAANAVTMTGPERTRAAWKEIASSLVGHARHAAKAKAEGETRTAFEHVSLTALRLLRAFGNPLGIPLRVAYCPMAFDDQGAQWVQSAEQIQNPYYGAAMLRCGEVRATLLRGERLGAIEQRQDSPTAPPSGHQH